MVEICYNAFVGLVHGHRKKIYAHVMSCMSCGEKESSLIVTGRLVCYNSMGIVHGTLKINMHELQ